MLEKLKAAAEYIIQFQKRLMGEAVSLRQSKVIFQETLERELIHKIEPTKIDGLVCAVDGGLLAQEMHGVDLIVVRSAGVLFSYTNSKLENVDYYPSAFPEPTFEIQVGLDEHEILQYRSLFRLKHEIKTALEIVELKKPAIMMLDGSILPLQSDRPADDSPAYPLYLELIALYKKLYSACEKENTLILGIIKDSRGRRFAEIFQSQVNTKSSDSVFLNYLLIERERTCAAKYSSSPQKNQIIKDLGDYGQNVCVFYLKPVANDRPLRVEFLSGRRTFNEIASIVYSLSAINSTYAYPAVLIEADLRAALDPIEIERAQKSLQMLHPESIRPLRRNSRPFR
ncbi:DNA double-strand break repair nuclease NurA [Candidatus Micrarchaeota archaeon]|nr:DNA double-strand break repair nuclease NurA [Candidatus Micrarchaeota archaeon]